MFLTDNAHLVRALTASSVKVNFYLSSTIFVFGVVGNILNILILTQRPLRNVPCIFLFMISSVANLISILFGLTPRIATTWQLDITATQDIPCKIRAFVLFSSRSVALWLTALAMIDRWVISSNDPYCRQWSSMKAARRGSLFITVLSTLLYAHMLHCYVANMNNTPLKCYGKTATCRLLTDITYAGFTVLLPLILMVVFGCMTISNIRKSRTFVASFSVKSVKYSNKERRLLFKRQKQRRRKLDRYLRRILLLQVILFILLTLPQSIHKIYFTVSTLFGYKSSVEYELDRFLYGFELLLPFIESSLPFYVYILTGGKIFRQAMKKLFSCESC